MEITFTTVQDAINAFRNSGVPKKILMNTGTLHAIMDSDFNRQLNQARKDDLLGVGEPCEFEERVFKERASKPEPTSGDKIFGIPFEIDETLALGEVRVQ